MSSLIDRLVFPAPAATYSKEVFPKSLCWIPWNEAVSPEKVKDEKYAEGIPCLWLPAPRAAGVLLFCHGNAEDLGMSYFFLKHMRDQFQMNVLAVEYPGYGLLGHVPASEAGVKEVVLTAFRFTIDELKVAYEQIILFGRSIGTGPAVYLASRFPVGGLILVAAFASIREVIRSFAGSIVAKAFVERFPNIALIGNVSCPTLFIHGEKDSLVPPTQSVALFRQCRARKLLITPPAMEHNTNLFTDASYLAVPAINFFGLPGYQQDSPPRMPDCFFEDNRSVFLLKMKQQGGSAKVRSSMNASFVDDSLWFLLCGCPTNKGRHWNANTGVNGSTPQMECSRPRDNAGGNADSLRPEEVSGPGSGSLLNSQANREQIDPDPGSPNTAARETAAGSRVRSRGRSGDSIPEESDKTWNGYDGGRPRPDS
eukprot:gnl/TRDRNA2_/TRDRNA2_198283_c0_seq1.p1 gnl/TRDRNA2_/TRDRNA2_198283_c0~~gnl/TRDRNA2_/TRDRNA2_198283_c0_seq1.p1  ORF type:complete len:425 (+),score=63.98 gnl/TRDRNA2_/TRDRNA2_198283_c0_seq1:63-1337(+)